MTAGVWNTDAHEETTVVKSAAVSIKLGGTATATSMDHDFLPTEEGVPYLHRFVVQADDATAGYLVKAQILYYQADKTTQVGATIDVHNAVIPTIDTWYEFSLVEQAPANARYRVVRMAKSAHNFNVYFDYAGSERMRYCFSAYKDNTQNISDSTSETIEFDTELYDYGSVFNTGTYTFTAPASGVYSFSANVQLDALTTGKHWVLTLVKNGSPLKVGAQQIYAGTWSPMASVDAAAIYLDRGDAVTVVGYHTNAGGAGLNTGSGAVVSSFMGAHVE